MQTLYLNNTGSRWTTRPTQEHEFETSSGKKIKRKAKFYEAFGNFALIAISYKGKIIKVFADSKLED